MNSKKVHHISAWERLNEPIAEPSENFGLGVIMVAILIMSLAWLTPHWDKARANVANYGSDYYTRQAALAKHDNQSRVAGATVSRTPEWYLALSVTASSMDEFFDENMVQPFTEASYELLDVSEDVEGVYSYYKPGVEAVWDAWLELMQDPY